MLTYRAPAVAGGLAVGLLSACLNLEKATEPNAPQLVVQAVLNTHELEQVILVSRARTGNTTGDEPVAGAVVTITTPSGATMASRVFPDSQGDCCVPGVYGFDNLGFPLIAGGTYALHVRAPSGEEVSGTTTIPATPPVVDIPARVFFRDRDTLHLSWAQVAGARRYEVLVEAESSSPQYRVFTDTSVVIPGTVLTILGDRVFDLGTVYVVVSAVDANYYDYYRAQSDPLAGAPPSNLTGAVGVFGSIVPILFGTLNVR